jgi:hypothetical protein
MANMINNYGAQYPLKHFRLNNEDDIKNAIQYFDFCPPEARSALAIRINNKSAELNIDPILEISLSNGIIKYKNLLTYYTIILQKSNPLYYNNMYTFIKLTGNTSNEYLNPNEYYSNLEESYHTLYEYLENDDDVSYFMKTSRLHFLIRYFIYEYSDIVDFEVLYVPLLKFGQLVDEQRLGEFCYDRFADAMHEYLLNPSECFSFPDKYRMSQSLLEIILRSKMDGDPLETVHIEKPDIRIESLNIAKDIDNLAPIRYNRKIRNTIVLDKLIESSYINTYCTTNNIYGDDITVAVKNDVTYLVTEKNNHVCLLTYNDYEQNLKVYEFSLNSEQKTKFNKDGMSLLTEGIQINKNGDIKFILGSKKSYMDLYSENHKLLIENWKYKNYQGVKHNLATAFALVNIIERDKKFKDGDKDLINARAHLINDFKSYYGKLQQIYPDFDFAKFYKESEYDKTIVEIPVDTIHGIKKLVNIILGL